MKRLPGFIDLIFEFVDETTSLVERTHAGVTERTVRRIPGESAEAAARGIADVHQVIARGVYQAIREVNGGVRAVVGTGATAIEQASPVVEELAGDETVHKASWGVDQLQALLNGIGGDRLVQGGSTLDIPMQLRVDGEEVAPTSEGLANAYPEARPKVCIFVHGLACTEWVWSIRSEEFYGDTSLDFGKRLERDCGYTPLYVRYNSGRSIAENGHALADLIQRVVEAYPVKINEIALIGHSMGGLVVRSAAHHARDADRDWHTRLRHVFCIGSPHLGAPLERAAAVLGEVLSQVDTAATQVLADIVRVRSQGIKDLGDGHTVTGADPEDTMPIDGVNYYSLAATITKDPEHPLGQLLGDWLVHPASGTGQSDDRHIPFQATHVFGGIDHVSLANHPDVYEAVVRWLGGETRR